MSKIMMDKKEHSILVTESVLSTQEAVEKKMKLVEPKFMGIKFVNYERNGRRKVLIPYTLLYFDFDINRNPLFKNNALFTETGQICAVFDMNEAHTSIYDLNDGHIPFVSKDISCIENVLPEQYSTEEMLETVKAAIHRKVIKKAYKAEGRLILTSSVRFYREAWELDLVYNNRHFKKYAYLDLYSRDNERVKGVKARIGV